MLRHCVRIMWRTFSSHPLGMEPRYCSFGRIPLASCRWSGKWKRSGKHNFCKCFSWTWCCPRQIIEKRALPLRKDLWASTAKLWFALQKFSSKRTRDYDEAQPTLITLQPSSIYLFYDRHEAVTHAVDPQYTISRRMKRTKPLPRLNRKNFLLPRETTETPTHCFGNVVACPFLQRLYVCFCTIKKFPNRSGMVCTMCLRRQKHPCQRASWLQLTLRKNLSRAHGMVRQGVPPICWRSFATLCTKACKYCSHLKTVILPWEMAWLRATNVALWSLIQWSASPWQRAGNMLRNSYSTHGLSHLHASSVIASGDTLWKFWQMLLEMTSLTHM